VEISLILDSGAFSAWTRKAQIDIDAYIAFIKAHMEHLDYYVNLDVIPGEFGRVPNASEVEASAQQGWENLLYMEEFGLHPVPVFHQGERFAWLERMINHGCSYIGISPANDRTTDQKRVWLDQAFSVVCDADGHPRVRTHGFGVTSIPLLHRYPWYSADSTSWILFGAYGMVLVPTWDETGFRYDQSPWSIVVSEQSAKALAEEGKHLDSFPENQKRRIVDYIEGCGLTLEEVRTNHAARAKCNAIFFHTFAAIKQDRPFRRVQRGFFS
jgi:hypothetical protein